MKHACEALWQSLQDPELPVRVNAAVSLIKLLGHEIAQELIKPGLGQLIRHFLKLIDDIDYDELIESLKTIVEIYEAEIGPYAVELCEKLGYAYLRMLENQKVTSGGGQELECDLEASLTADGLITAIRRVLQSISGKFPTLYPQLEQLLKQPIIESIRDPAGNSVDEGLTCLSELLYN